MGARDQRELLVLRGARRRSPPLLQVLFNQFGRTLARQIRILTELLTGAALPQKIPQPIELAVHVIEPAAIAGAKRVALIEQRVFFGDELFDVLVQFLIVHGVSLPANGAATLDAGRLERAPPTAGGGAASRALIAPAIKTARSARTRVARETV